MTPSTGAGGTKVPADGISSGRGGGRVGGNSPYVGSAEAAKRNPESFGRGVAEGGTVLKPVASERPTQGAQNRGPRGGGASRDSLAVGVYVGGGGVSVGGSYSSGVGYASAFHDAHYGYRGYGPYCYDPFWSLPHWPGHGAWYGCGYGAPWYGYGSYFGYAYPCGSSFSIGHWSNRWWFGFGYGSWCGYGDVWYPSYRTCRYYPYYYYSTAIYYPAYTTVYVRDCPSSTYVDASDPYVEIVDEVPTSIVADAAPVRRAGDGGLPAVFATPLVAEYPSGLTSDTYLERARQEFAAGRYWDAAEARRRAWAASPGSADRAVGLGYALYAAGRYDLAASAFRAAYALDASIVKWEADLSADFGSAAAAKDARASLERRIVGSPDDAEARFVLASAAFWGGDWFAARSEFAALGATEGSAADFRAEADRRLLAAGK